MTNDDWDRPLPPNEVVATGDIHVLSLERRTQWRQYQRHMEQAAYHINEAQRYHRDIFERENGGLLVAVQTLSIEYERTGQPPRECDDPERG